LEWKRRVKGSEDMVNPDCLQGYAFVNKFAEDYRKLEEAGFSEIAIKRMMGQLQYVKEFVGTPEWLVSAKKLPKGCKWSEGKKYSLKGGKRSDSITYIFLTVGDDLYIRNLVAYWIKTDEETNFRRNSPITYIKNWKSMRSHHVVFSLKEIMNPFLETCIHEFWSENGGSTSMIEGGLRDYGEKFGGGMDEMF
jgi:hypothetical protein